MNMDQERLNSMIIDYIDGKLNTVDKQFIEQELVNNADAYKLYEQLREVMHTIEKAEQLEPSAKLKEKFDDFLQSEIGQQKTKTVFFTPVWYRVAAAVALLVVGGGVGYWISQQNRNKQEILALQMEIETVRRLALAQMNNDESASQRMLGIMAVYESVQTNKPDDEIVDALVTTMNTDGNSNVRLAAIEALSKFTEEEKVRKALVQSLSAQRILWFRLR